MLLLQAWLVSLVATPWLIVVLTLGLGVSAYKLTILLHDCAHGTLFLSPGANRTVGHVAASLLATSFDGYKKSHWEHHRHCGTDQDNFDGAYLPPPDATRGEIVWHLAKPLVGAGAVMTLASHFRPAAAGDGNAGRSVAARMRPLAMIAGAQLAVAALATGFGRRPLPALLYPLSAATVGVFLSRLRTLCEHAGGAGHDGPCFARTHAPNIIDRAFFYTLHFNYHVEHHLFPQLPSCRLPQIHESLVKAGFFQTEMKSTSILGTVAAHILGARRRRP